MATISKLMQQLQTQLANDGVSLENAALAVEYGVAWHCCTAAKVSVSKKLKEFLERPGRGALPGLFVFSDSPQDHHYWADIAWRG